ncbi:CotH kinase family protein [Hymenobacter sp. BT186]|uniref:CotH kinase family protein n=1 Tax=Hymenobacter telluris TaxID=2816474 RepID=A0A939EU21_9BACT|nr:CotH kinase family protein [Hymenobacter telluris]MBO0357227.1 CotH kinase family protein [Hymenobacter telluris]MBW3373253.1 CotH kinase family protein [Hymenobacter norwichensis]
MSKKLASINLVLLITAFTLSISKASASDTIRVRPNLYHIDHHKNIVIINQSTSELISGAGEAKNHLLLDETYEFLAPVYSVNESASYKVVCRDSMYTAYFTKLPIIHINTRSQIVDTPSVYASFSMSENNRAFTQSAIGIELRGASSQSLPKKSYELSFWSDTLGAVSRDVRLLNMRTDNKWNLQAMYNEPLRMQSKVSNELWQDIHQIYYKNLEPDAKNGIAMTYVEVFVNDEYKGIYALSERIDRKQLKLKKYDNQTIKGELYKGSGWGATTFTSLPPFDNTSLTWGGFEYKHPEEEIDWTNLYNFVDFVENSSTQDFNNNYKTKFKLSNAVDYYIFLNLLRSLDNTGKNIYIAKYKAGEPYYYVPWDLDGVFGTNWQGNQDNVTNGLLSNGFYDRLNQDCSPNGFRAALVQRWAELRTTVINQDSIMSRFAVNTNYLVNNNAYEREHIAWNDFTYDATQLTYVASWLSNRLAYLDVVFSQSCTALSNVSAIATTGLELKMYPNPATGYLVIENNFSAREMCVQDMSGKIIMKQALNSKTSKVDISALPKGLYITTVRSEKTSKRNKLVVN